LKIRIEEIKRPRVWSSGNIGRSEVEWYEEALEYSTAQKLLGFEVEGGRKRRNGLAPFYVTLGKAAIRIIYE